MGLGENFAVTAYKGRSDQISTIRLAENNESKALDSIFENGHR